MRRKGYLPEANRPKKHRHVASSHDDRFRSCGIGPEIEVKVSEQQSSHNDSNHVPCILPTPGVSLTTAVDAAHHASVQQPPIVVGGTRRIVSQQGLTPLSKEHKGENCSDEGAQGKGSGKGNARSLRRGAGEEPAAPRLSPVEGDEPSHPPIGVTESANQHFPRLHTTISYHGNREGTAERG